MLFRILLTLALGTAVANSAPTATAQPQARFVSLRECIELALTRNLDIQISRLNADMMGYSLTGAYVPYVPVLSFMARHDFVSQPGDVDPQKFNMDQPYELNTDQLGPSLTGQLPIGLGYAFNAYTREENMRTDFRGTPADAAFFKPDGIRRTNNYYSEARLDLTQHLLKDSWIDAERQTIQLRRKGLKMSEQAFRFQIMKTVLAVELNYYDLVSAREMVKVQQEALKFRQQFLKETRRRVELGDLPPLDAEQAETQLQITLTALSAAREALASQENTLKSLITDDFNAWVDIDLIPADPLAVVRTEVNREESVRSALNTRPDLKEARLAVEQKAVIVRYRKNQLFPTLDVVGRYGGLGVASAPGPSTDQAKDLHDPTYFYGAVLSVPLTLAAERGNYRASKAAKEIAELQLKKAEQDVLWQVIDHINRVAARLDRVTSTRKARAYAASALAAEEKKLDAGLTTSFVVLELQQILTRAATAEVEAISDYNRMLAQLAFEDGTILEKTRIDVQAK
ncbi:MAG TPA: TolC family protein [Verrucomicrobiae bacterium]